MFCYEKSTVMDIFCNISKIWKSSPGMVPFPYPEVVLQPAGISVVRIRSQMHHMCGQSSPSKSAHTGDTRTICMFWTVLNQKLSMQGILKNLFLFSMKKIKKLKNNLKWIFRIPCCNGLIFSLCQSWTFRGNGLHWTVKWLQMLIAYCSDQKVVNNMED